MADTNTKPGDEVTFPKHLCDKESRELRTAIYDDWKRKAINDAKFCACDQHVDYPTFANLVSVAHLKPVERKTPGEEFAEGAHVYKGTAEPSWSFDGAGAEKEEEDGIPALLGLGKPGAFPERKLTDTEFAKHWRRLNEDVFLQMAFLTGIDPADFSEMFKVEVPPNLLAEMLATICTCLRAGENARANTDRQRLLRAACARDVDENWAVNMLEAMSQCGRFSLAIGFIGEQTRAMVRALLSHLVDSPWCAADGETVVSSSRLSRIQKIREVYRLQAKPS